MNTEELETLVDENEIEHTPEVVEIPLDVREENTPALPKKDGVSNTAIILTVVLLLALIGLYVWYNIKQARALQHGS